MASVCGRIRRICASTASHVIWDVGARSMAAFEDAIIAVRATELVKAAFVFGVPPPDLSPVSSLGRPAGNPTMHEIAAALGLRHLVRCTEEMFIQWNLDSPARELRYVGAQGDWAETRAAWTERFHRSAYRIFVAGAMLSRAYHEPFFREDSSAKDGFVDAYVAEFDLVKACNEEHDVDCSECPPLGNMQDSLQQEYLKQFVVYDPEDFEVGNLDRQTAVFGAFAEWVMHETDIRAESETYTQVRRNPFDNTTIARIWNVSQLNAAYEHITSKIVSAPGHYCRNHQSQTYLRFAEEPTATRTATVVMFGSFSPEEITMPACIADAKDSVLLARKIGRRREQDPSLLLDLVFEPFFATSPGRGRRAGHPSPPPPLQLFEFMLKKYAGLRFVDDAWEVRGDAPYAEFLDYVNAFSADTNENNRYSLDIYQRL
ncbi:hypothetical protein CcaCcLH18_13392 [Colletotrichum camelliae]|nr:hypothetical protein CcaCcLH18_13392 [Colletotrichum camelliae]